MRKSLYTAMFVVIAGSQLGATDCGQAIRDTGFDLWCGDSLCAWKIERGNIARVPTWSDGDPGVSLVGDDVAIEQLSPVASTDDNGGCIEFDLIANVDEHAEVDLHIDLFGDGTIEDTERIPTSNWKPLTFLVPIQGAYSGIRFELAKTGSGNAVLAQISAQTATGCGGLAPIFAPPAPLGATCASNSGCASGACDPNLHTCAGCEADGDCTGGDVCGLGPALSPVRYMPQECVPAAQTQLADNCETNEQCASGICTYGACSTCTGATCGDGETCGPAWGPPPSLAGYYYTTPFVCSPGGGIRAAGEPCAINTDCASNRCNGTPRSQCDDGRECATAADCPFGGPDTTDPLQQGPCNPAGIQGGSCQ